MKAPSQESSMLLTSVTCVSITSGRLQINPLPVLISNSEVDLCIFCLKWCFANFSWSKRLMRGLFGLVNKWRFPVNAADFSVPAFVEQICKTMIWICGCANLWVKDSPSSFCCLFFLNVLGILAQHQHLWAVFSVNQIKTHFMSHKLCTNHENVIYEAFLYLFIFVI